MLCQDLSHHLSSLIQSFLISLLDGLLSEAQSAYRLVGSEEQGKKGAGGKRRRPAVGARGRSGTQLLQQLLEKQPKEEEEVRGEWMNSSVCKGDRGSCQYGT